MKPWKPEYVELLRQNIEELRHVKFIDNRGRKITEKPSKKNRFSGSVAINQVPTILESFGKTAGFGCNLKQLLPPDRKESSDAVAAFLLFVLERQKIWLNKSRGVTPLTENLVMGGKWFTNMYRELDRGTMYVLQAADDEDLSEET